MNAEEFKERLAWYLEDLEIPHKVPRPVRVLSRDPHIASKHATAMSKNMGKSPETAKAHKAAAASFMHHSNKAAAAGKHHLAKTLMRGYAHHSSHPHASHEETDLSDRLNMFLEKISPVSVKKAKVQKVPLKQGKSGHPMSKGEVHRFLQKLFAKDGETDEEFFGVSP